jgi:hypothetical protein
MRARANPQEGGPSQSDRQRRSKSNNVIKSVMAGPFMGTYGFSGRASGFGRLSRLRSDSGDTRQLRSMNFRMDT